MRSIIILLLLAASLLSSTDEGLVEDEEANFEELFLEGIEEATQVASNTKTNIDDTPAFITILKGNTLMEFGVENLHDAMMLVPGVEISMEPSGAKQLIFRGVKEKGKIKLMIDGMVVNNIYRGSIYHYLDMPIELIERIEVIRGPGSVIYGSNAMSGVINVITYHHTPNSNDNQIFAAYSTEDTQKEGLFFQEALTENLSYAFDGYYQTREEGVATGLDSGGSFGESDEELRDYMLGAAVKYKNFKIQGRVKNSRAGLAYGMANYLESELGYSGNRNKTTLLEAEYSGEIAHGYDYRVKAGVNSYTQKIEGRMLPTNKGDLIYLLNYDEQSYYGGVTFNISALERHRIAAGIEHQYAKEKSTALNTFLESTPDVAYFATDTALKKGVSREINSLFFNDEYTPIEKLDIVTGIRYDNYSDFGDAISPRVALIYRQSPELNFKAMYSRAFRAPSWIEMYATIPNVSIGNESLHEESADTFEVGVVYKKGVNDLLRLNIYNTSVENIVYRDLVSREYIQDATQEFQGVEIEARKSLRWDTNLKVAMSWISAKDNEGKKIPNIANINANAQLSHVISKTLSSYSTLYYVSKRSREEGDSRDPLEGYSRVDQSIEYKRSNWKIVMSVKNLFDEDIRYPASPDTYADDYLREGRVFAIRGVVTF